MKTNNDYTQKILDVGEARRLLFKAANNESNDNVRDLLAIALETLSRLSHVLYKLEEKD